MGTEFQLGVMKNVWNYIKGMIAQHCECAKCHPVGYFKMVTTAFWVELCAPQIHMLKSPDSLSLRMGPYLELGSLWCNEVVLEEGGILIQQDWKSGHRSTEAGRTAYEHKDRNWDDSSINQGTQGFPAPPEAGREARISPRTSRRNQSCLHLDFRLLFFKEWFFCCFEPRSGWHFVTAALGN